MRALTVSLALSLLIAAAPALGATLKLENRTPDRLALKAGGKVLCEAAPGGACTAKVGPGELRLSAVADNKRSLDLSSPVGKGGFIWRVHYLNPAPEFHVQAGTFSVQRNATRLKAKLARYGNATVQGVRVKGKPYWRVRIGPVANRAQGQAILRRVVRMGFKDAVLFHY